MHNFQLLGRVCQTTGSISYRQAWENTVGANKNKFGTLIVVLCIIIKPGLGCLAYSLLLADSCQSLDVAMGLGEYITLIVVLMFLFYGVIRIDAAFWQIIVLYRATPAKRRISASTLDMPQFS
jgi:hypothetical protein